MEDGFRILEHPADMGIEARGRSLKSAFRYAALGLLSIIVDPGSVDPAERRSAIVKGSDVENLLVKWLSEIIYLYDGEDYLVSEINMKSLSPTELEADLIGEWVDVKKHRFKMDVKAITYHQLKVEERPDGCLVRVFLDI
jgi:SHS2 domain-containing protein